MTTDSQILNKSKPNQTKPKSTHTKHYPENEEKINFHSAGSITRIEYDFSLDKALVGSSKITGCSNKGMVCLITFYYL